MSLTYPWFDPYLFYINRKQVIMSEKKFDFLKDLVASIPDVQGEEESTGGEPSIAPARPAKRQPSEPKPATVSAPPTGKRPRGRLIFG